ncbi:hypothetical protein JCM10449v2_006554 [Rhodotorula kratochvilovae]
MSASHPLFPQVAPALQRYPHQANALFQCFVDLSLAQQWRDVEVVDLDECGCAVVRGRPRLPKKCPPAVVLPMNLTAPTSLAALTAGLDAVSARYPSSSASSTAPDSPEPTAGTEGADSPTIYLAMIEKDGSIVYYVLRQGIVSPKEVPE